MVLYMNLIFKYEQLKTTLRLRLGMSADITNCFMSSFNQVSLCKKTRTIYCLSDEAKPLSHQPCGSRAPICDDKFVGFVRQPHGVVNNTARLPCEKQGRKAAATNFRHVHFLCDLFAFSERRTTAARHTRLPQDCCKTRKAFVRLTL